MAAQGIPTPGKPTSGTVPATSPTSDGYYVNSTVVTTTVKG